MRLLVVATGCMSLLVACGGVQPAPSAPPESRRLEADLDQAWEATLRTLTERGYEIRSVDRARGLIQTDWLTINPEYAATIFMTQQEDRYSDCGKPGLGQAFRGKQVRLEVALQPIRRGETGFRVDAAFRTQRYADAPLWAGRPLGDANCRSRGRLEDEVRVEVQFRAFADQWEKIRRGAR